MRRFIFTLLLCFISPYLFASSTIDPLPVNAAYQISAQVRDNQTVIINWKIAPGYALYQDKFQFKTAAKNAATLAAPLMPLAIKKYDKVLGHYRVYENTLSIALPVIQAAHPRFQLRVHYQGCANAGFCYPPQNRVFNINLNGPYAQALSPIAASTPQTANQQAQGPIARLLSEKHTLWIMLSFLGFGLLLSFTPCVLPMLPILSSIIVKQKSLSTARASLLSCAYVLGVSLTYALAGICFALLGENIQTSLQLPWVTILFALLFVIMACSLFGLFTVELPQALRQILHGITNTQKPGSLFGTFIMGICSTLILSPCVTPPLVGALSFISHTHNVLLGGLALFSLGIGTGIPLLIIGTLGGKYLPQAGKWMDSIKHAFGFLMLALALYMLARILPAQVSMCLWAILTLAAAISFGALTLAYRYWIQKLISLTLLCYSFVLFTGLYLGHTNPLKPIPTGTTIQSSVHFTRVRSLSSFKKILRTSTKPVMLDFYADWCESCKEMDAYTFTNAQVKALLSHFTVLRVDVTKSTAFTKAIEKRYAVVAPPTMLFFNTTGQWLTSATIIGAVNANTLSTHLRGLIPGAVIPGAGRDL